MSKHRDDLICEKYLLRVGWAVDIRYRFEGLCSYEDTLHPTKYLKYDDERNSYHIRIKEIDGCFKYELVIQPPEGFLLPTVSIKELKKIDRFENLFYELTDICLEEIPRDKHLRFETLEDFNSNETYKKYMNND